MKKVNKTPGAWAGVTFLPLRPVEVVQSKNGKVISRATVQNQSSAQYIQEAMQADCPTCDIRFFENKS